MRKCVGELMDYDRPEKGGADGVILARVSCGKDMLLVERPTRKQAVLAANRLLKKLGWELKEAWRAE